MPRSEIDLLYALLGEEDKLLGAIAEAAEVKKTALVAVDRPGIEKANRLEEPLIRELAILEHRRITLFHAIADHSGIEGEITLETIGRAFGEPLSTRLGEIKKRITEKAKDVKRITMLNHTLAAQSLGHVHGILKLISNGGDEPTYGPPKSRKTAPLRQASLIVDRRV